VKDAHGAVVTDRVVTWTSSRTDVATVSTAGVVTGIAAGTARVVATSEGFADSATITVVNPPIASVTVQPSPASVQVGATVALTATVVDSSGAVVTGASITWSSSNLTVATVSPTGVVTGRSVGSATITATSGGKSGSANIAVIPVPVARVSLAPDSVLLAPGATATLTASTLAADGTVLTGRPITFTTDNAGVAKVSATGMVTGVAAGSAVITATSEGKSATAKVVVQVPVASVTVTPSSVSLRRHGTVQLSAVARDAAGNVLTGRDFTWTSSDSQVASVDGSGFVTTNKTGAATITVTVEGRSDASRITVTN
jgi:trimeric autotransporter adhesin